MGAAFVWFYWSQMTFLVRIWWTQEDYQHGFLVPMFAAFLLWFRRDMRPRGEGHGSLWGLALFGVWALMWGAASSMKYDYPLELAIIPFLLGVAIFVGGWQGLRWAWPAILFLGFMLPLPGMVQDFSRAQLQKLATTASVFIIQTLGIQAVASGVVIELADNHSLRVEEACSGLRMMMLFIAICVGTAFVVKRPLWEKLVMVASAAPIAVISNVARIVLTALLFQLAGLWPSLISTERAETFMHDFAGLLMAPLGVALLMAETALMSKLLISTETGRPLVAGRVLAEGEIGVATEAGLRRRRRG
jgi:exosortase